MSALHTVAIMQPTYLPWIGYSIMIDRVDEFVLFGFRIVLASIMATAKLNQDWTGELLLTVPGNG